MQSGTTHHKTTGFFFLMLLASAYGTSNTYPETTELAIDHHPYSPLEADDSSLTENFPDDTDPDQEKELISSNPIEEDNIFLIFLNSPWTINRLFGLAIILAASLTLKIKLPKLKQSPEEETKEDESSIFVEKSSYSGILDRLLAEWNAVKDLALLNKSMKIDDSALLKMLKEEIDTLIHNYLQCVQRCFLINTDKDSKEPIIELNILNKAFKYIKKSFQYLTLEKKAQLLSQIDSFDAEIKEENKRIIKIQLLIQNHQNGSITLTPTHKLVVQLDVVSTLTKFKAMLNKSKPALEKVAVPLIERFNPEKTRFDKVYNDYKDKIDTLKNLQKSMKPYHPHDSELAAILSYNSKPFEELYKDTQNPTEAKLVKLTKEKSKLENAIANMDRVISRLKRKKSTHEQAQKEKAKNKEPVKKEQPEDRKETLPEKKVERIKKAVPLPAKNTSKPKASSTARASAPRARAPLVPAPPVTLFTSPQKHPRVEKCEEVFEILLRRFEHDVKKIPDEAYTDIVILLKALITDWGLHYRLPSRRSQFRDNLIYDLEIIINQEDITLTELWKAVEEYYELSSGLKLAKQQPDSTLLKQINQLRYTSYQDENLSQYNAPFHLQKKAEIEDDMKIVACSSFLTDSEKLYLVDCLSLLRDKHSKNAGISITGERRKEVNKFSHPQKFFTTSQASASSTADTTSSSSFSPWKRWFG